ncbi:TPA: hypothetical protein NKT41_004555 [Vibrio parahaemolyticus]|nr:hypothetical protein [Vibrio parahaemolyticus]
MARILIFIFLFMVGFTVNAEQTPISTENQNNLIEVRSKPDAIVESTFSLFPNAAEKSIFLLPIKAIDGFTNTLPSIENIQIDKPYSAYIDKNNEFYHQTQNQLRQRGGTDSMIERSAMFVCSILTILATVLFVYILFFRGAEYVVAENNEDNNETEDVKHNSAKISTNLLILIVLIAPIPSWNTNVLITIMTTILNSVSLISSYVSSWLMASLYTSAGMLAPNLDQDETFKRLESELLWRDVEDVVVSRIINDAHLDSELRKKWPDGKPASNEGLVRLAQLQSEAAKALPEYVRVNVDENCFISGRDYVQTAKRPECRWMLDSTEYGADINNARLNIEFSPTLVSEKDLTASEKYFREQLRGAFNDAVNAVDDYKRSIICPRVHGQRVTIDELEYSLFCSKKDGSGELIGGFYGYTTTDGVWFDAADDYSYDENGNVNIQEFNKLAALTKTAAKKLIELESKSSLKDRDATVIYHSGIIDSSFRIVNGIVKAQSELASMYSSATKKVMGVTVRNVLLSLTQNYSYNSKTIKQLSESDVPAFLEKNYPYLRNIWFEDNTRDSDSGFNLKSLSEVTLSKDPFSQKFDDFSFYSNLAVAMIVGGFVADKFRWEATGNLISSLGFSALMVAIVIFCTNALSLAFTVKVGLLLLCRLTKLNLFYMAKPVASVFKNTFLTNEEVNKESDWALVSNIKTLIIDTGLLFVFAVMANFAAYVLVYYSAEIVYEVVNSTSLFDSSSILDSIIKLLIGFFLYLFIMYKCLFDSPFKVLTFSGNLLDDEARDDIKKGESLSSLLKIFNVKSYI